MSITRPDQVPPVYCPVIVSDWSPFFRPEKTGHYINDHSLVRGFDGRWHLYGITANTERPQPQQERYFAHGVGARIGDGVLFDEHGIVCDFGVTAWAPAVVVADNRMYMIYGPSPTKLAVSRDGFEWFGATISLVGAPIDACHRDHMILALDSSTWLMYATGLDEDGLGAISVFVSNDLINWRFVRFALTTRGRSALRPAWGATESPFVIRYDGWFYLSVTYTDSTFDNYHNTLLFRSLNPFDFGEFDADAPHQSVIQTLRAHAPEYVCDDDGNWFVTTCGWKGFDVPNEGAVSIAKLDWRKA